MELYAELKALYAPLAGQRQWDFGEPERWELVQRPLLELLLEQPGPVVWLWARAPTRSGEDYVSGWEVHGSPLQERPVLRPLHDVALRQAHWVYSIVDPYGVHADEYSVMLLELPRGEVEAAVGQVHIAALEKVNWLAPVSKLALRAARANAKRSAGAMVAQLAWKLLEH